MDKPILFLDIDGVLNTYYSQGCFHIDRDKIKILEQTLDIDYDIVLVSTWRLLLHEWRIYDGRHLRNIIGDKIFSRIIDKTPVINAIRGYEVDKWMQEHGTPPRYAIIDDDVDYLDYQKPHLIVINGMTGITESDVCRIKELLTAGE